MIDQLRELLGSRIVAAELVGSRITCDPVPVNTDMDILLHVRNLSEAEAILIYSGWVIGGSNIPSDENHTQPDEYFLSFTLGEINLLVTMSALFCRRFIAATYVAKRLNLRVKADRIALFQAVLYGNRPEE